MPCPCAAPAFHNRGLAQSFWKPPDQWLADLHALLPGRGGWPAAATPWAWFWARAVCRGRRASAGAAGGATPADGLVAGEVSFAVNGAQVYAYRARAPGAHRPAGGAGGVGDFGVHRHIADVCRRLAQAGYLAIARICLRARATPWPMAWSP